MCTVYVSVLNVCECICKSVSLCVGLCFCSVPQCCCVRVCVLYTLVVN